MNHLGIDIGYSSVKLAHGINAKPELLQLPVGAAPISKCGLAVDGEASIGAGHRVSINGEDWVAGVDPSRLADFVPTMDETYLTTDEYRALFYASLSAVGVETIDMLVTGLPVSHFLNAGLKSGLEKMLLGAHNIRSDLRVEVKNVMVVPQPVGAFAAHLVDSAMTPERVNAGDSILVVDPGHYSLDWVMYLNSFRMDTSGSTSEAGEVMVRRAAEMLTESHGVRVTPSRLQEAVMTSAGPLVVGRHSIEFWPAMQSVAGDIVNRNLRKLRASIRKVVEDRGVDRVLVTGGGAELFVEPLKLAFPDAVVSKVSSPVLSNARGFYQYARTEHGRRLAKSAA